MSLQRFTFRPDVRTDDIEQAVVLAIMVIEILHEPDRGPPGPPICPRYVLDRKGRFVVIDDGTSAGADLVKLMRGLMNREYGPEAWFVTTTQRAAFDWWQRGVELGSWRSDE